MWGRQSPPSSSPCDSPAGSAALNAIARADTSSGGRIAMSIAVVSGFSRTVMADSPRSVRLQPDRQRQRLSAFVAANRRHHDVGHHVEEPRIVVDGFGARHRQPDVAADGGGFAVEVVDDLEVVAEESDRT